MIAGAAAAEGALEGAPARAVLGTVELVEVLGEFGSGTAAAAADSGSAVGRGAEELEEEEGGAETTVGSETRKEGENGDRPCGLGMVGDVDVDVVVVGECWVGV